MPDKTRREPTPEELDHEAKITPADVDRMMDFADEVAPPLLRNLLRAKPVDGEERER